MFANIIKHVFLIVSISSCVLCQQCNVFDFENDWEEDFEMYCLALDSWVSGTYDELEGVVDPPDGSSTYIRPSTGMSCISVQSIMNPSGFLDVTFYMDGNVANLLTVMVISEGNSILLYEQIHSGVDGFVNGWQTRRIHFTANGDEHFVGQITLMGTEASNSLLLIDSFRYLPSENYDENCVFTDPVTEPDEIETEPETGEETEPEIEPDSESETESENEQETAPETEQETEPDSESETESETEQESEPEIEPDSESETESENEQKTAPETEQETEPDIEPDLETESETEQELEPEIEPDSESDTEPEIEQETEPEIEQETEPEIEPESESETEPDTPETQPESVPEIETETQPEVEPDTELETETDPETVTETEPETDLDSISETGPEIGPVTETDANTGFWAPITISLVVLLAFIIFSLICIAFYQLGKYVAEKQEAPPQIIFTNPEDLPKTIIVPRITRVYTQPSYGGYDPNIYTGGNHIV